MSTIKLQMDSSKLVVVQGTVVGGDWRFSIALAATPLAIVQTADVLDAAPDPKNAMFLNVAAGDYVGTIQRLDNSVPPILSGPSGSALFTAVDVGPATSSISVPDVVSVVVS